MNNENLKPFTKDDDRASECGKKSKRKGIETKVQEFLDASDGDKTREQLIMDALFKYGTDGNVKALEVLLDRGYGKPKQSIETENTHIVTQPIKIEFED